MTICYIAEGYPFDNYAQYPFVEQLSLALADLGHRVLVVAPQSLTRKVLRKKPYIPYYRTAKTEKGNVVEIYTPKIITIGNFPCVGLKYSSWRFRCAVDKTLRKIQLKEKIDVCYGHFWHVAISAYPFCLKYNIPIFVASGESSILINRIFPSSKIKAFSSFVKGVVCASTKTKEESIEKCFVDEIKCRVYPNGIDETLFYPQKNKLELRHKLGIKDDDFVVVFTGTFIRRKGAKRVSQAIEDLHDSHIKSIFIGGEADGEVDAPFGNGIIHCGPLAHDQIPNYLNCGDVFVLPTLAEGCCNAIVEALACGMPIISSDRSFNYDILDKTNSILIDPKDIPQISQAISFLKSNPNICAKMGLEATNRAKELSISKRAKKIVDFFDSNKTYK